VEIRFLILTVYHDAAVSTTYSPVRYTKQQERLPIPRDVTWNCKLLVGSCRLSFSWPKPRIYIIILLLANPVRRKAETMEDQLADDKHL